VERATLWSRVGHWLRTSARSGGHDPYAPIGPNAPGDDGGVPPMGTGVIPPEAPVPTPKFRLARATSNVERLEEEYAKVVKLVESVQTHLEQQGERSESIARSLSRLAESLGHLPEASKTQLELLSTISQQMSADSACTKRVEENLSQLPRLADAQRETMVSIGRQLDLSRQTSDRVGTTLEGFQQAVTLLGEATGSSAKALQEMRWDASAREERVATILREQTRRFTIFAAVAVGLLLLAGVVGAIALIR